MRQELNLFLGDMEIEFNQPPELLYNYTENDLKNPSVVKNSYSKTLTIEGTPNNNKIFGHFWNLERIQDYGNGKYIGSYFNPLQKADFTLYLNGEIYESGYFKLDKVTKNGNNVSYEITLYGGLGSFFYNLSYSHNNGEVTGPDKLTLADLIYSFDGEVPELDFTINKETVNTAWGTILGGEAYDSKFELINFAPCYNGMPKNFDTNKVIYNNYGSPGSSSNKFIPDSTTDGDKTYKPFNPYSGTIDDNGFSLLQTTENLTEWEVCDLRSYLQRPVIRVKGIIEACCNPENNMGYEVKLDESFFNQYNPYYEKSWITMPLLKDLDIKSTEDVEAGADAHLAAIDKNKYSVEDDDASFNNYTNVKLSTKIRFAPEELEDAPENLYTNRYGYFNQKMKFPTEPEVKLVNPINGAVLVQMVGLNAAKEVVNSSDLLYLSSDVPGDESADFFVDDFQKFSKEWTKISNAPINAIRYEKGYFSNYSDGQYVWCNNNGVEQIFNFRFNEDKPVDSIEIRYAALDIYKTKYEIRYPLSSNKMTIGPNVTELDRLFVSTNYTSTMVLTQSGQIEDLIKDVETGETISGEYNLLMTDLSYSKTRKGDFFSNTKITKKDILTTDKTPCEYLLSYCKQFGLYFFKDANEISSDPEKYPNGVIHIMSRNTFYDTDNVVNLEDYIDRSKDITITPQIPATKWYDFGLNVEESEAEKDFKNATNMHFGTNRVNTGYNFDADKTDVFKDNAFKGGIMVSERDKYYQYPDWSENPLRNALYGIPAYAYNGLNVKLYNLSTGKLEGAETASKTLGLPTERPICPIPEFEGYDLFPKLQFHAQNNDPVKGDGVLVFFRGESPYWGTDVEGKINFWLSDDNEAMAALNGKPCWQLTLNERDSAGNRIAIKRNVIPYFSRYIDYPGTGIITHTWDIGRSRGFVPYLYETEGMSIYEKVWKDYTSDIYSINSKLLTCYCLLENRPNPEWLRRFYWFDNSIWRLNRIIDWNVSSYDTTKMEFIKVQDLKDYTFEDITDEGKFYLVLDKTIISKDGGIVTGCMYGQDMGNIWLSDVITILYDDGTEDSLQTPDYIRPSRGTGVVYFEFDVPANNKPQTRTLTIRLPKEVSLHKHYEATLTQEPQDPGFKPVRFVNNSLNFGRGESEGNIEYFVVEEGTTDVQVHSTASWIQIANVEESYYEFAIAQMLPPSIGVGGSGGPVSRTGSIIITGTYQGQQYSDECIIRQSYWTIAGGLSTQEGE